MSAMRWPSPARHARREWWVSAGVAASAVAAHLFLLTSFTLGAEARQKLHKPEVQGAGASASNAEGEPESAMILIDLSALTPAPEATFPEPASNGLQLRQPFVRIFSPDSAPAFEFDADDPEHEVDSPTKVAAGDEQQRALLFGRYVGQVSARIERAWTKPRTPANDADDFECRARILQRPDGNIDEVMLLDCNGSGEWQQSLVSAIQQAAPLPIAPHPSVFAHALTLRFEAHSATAAGVR
jgi:TonB-like protein